MGESFRMHAPLATALEHVQHGVEDFIQTYSARLGAPAYRFQKGKNLLKLLPTYVARIRLS